VDNYQVYSFLFLVYIGLCVMTGFMGRRTVVGFWGFLFLSILITPFLPMLAMLLTRPAEQWRTR
jgi:hypothetical protein